MALKDILTEIDQAVAENPDPEFVELSAKLRQIMIDNYDKINDAYCKECALANELIDMFNAEWRPNAGYVGTEEQVTALYKGCWAKARAKFTLIHPEEDALKLQKYAEENAAEAITEAERLKTEN